MPVIKLMAMSLRKNSFNKKLIENAERILTDENTIQRIQVLQFNDFIIPIYNGDLETQEGIPEGVRSLGNEIQTADALIFSTPEYNGGIPAPFKNAIDWVSRLSPMPWAGKKLLLLGASPGGLGAVRGLAHSRIPLEALGVFVYPEMFGLAHANVAFDEQAKLKDVPTEERLKKLLNKFLKYVG